MTREQIAKANAELRNQSALEIEAAEDESMQEFREQCRRQLDRPLAARMKYGFNRVYKPVLDDAPWRSFSTLAEYRAWCADNLPEYLGFKPANK